MRKWWLVPLALTCATWGVGVPSFAQPNPSLRIAGDDKLVLYPLSRNGFSLQLRPNVPSRYFFTVRDSRGRTLVKEDHFMPAITTKFVDWSGRRPSVSRNGVEQLGELYPLDESYRASLKVFKADEEVRTSS